MFGKILFGVAMAIGGVVVSQFLGRKPRNPVFNIQIGDMIQWESKGAFVFPIPRKVINIEGGVTGKYIFVEDSGCGIPIEQVVLVNRASVIPEPFYQ